IGAEDKADTPPGHREGPVGPGRVLQHILGDRGEVVATVYCGDNYAGEKPGAMDEILDLIAKYRPDIVIAGPAFSAGRYGLACGEVTLRARARLHVTSVTGMHVDNAATEVYRTKLHIASTQRTAASMAGADTLPPEQWQSVHGGFNTSRINEDPHRVVPLDVARELEREGVIGRLHPELFSTTGNTSVIPTMRRFAHEMAGELRAAGVD